MQTKFSSECLGVVPQAVNISNRFNGLLWSKQWKLLLTGSFQR